MSAWVFAVGMGLGATLAGGLGVLWVLRNVRPWP